MSTKENGHWPPYPASPWHLREHGRHWTAMERFDEERERCVYLTSLILQAREFFVRGDYETVDREQFDRWMDEAHYVKENVK